MRRPKKVAERKARPIRTAAHVHELRSGAPWGPSFNLRREGLCWKSDLMWQDHHSSFAACRRGPLTSPRGSVYLVQPARGMPLLRGGILTSPRGGSFDASYPGAGQVFSSSPWSAFSVNVDAKTGPVRGPGVGRCNLMPRRGPCSFSHAGRRRGEQNERHR